MSNELNMIDGTDKHCALAFLESDHMKYIKCVQNDAVVRGYLYNKETALWKLFMSTNDIFYIVSDFLEAYYKPFPFILFQSIDCRSSVC